jgi:hypothetical protein
MQGPRFTPSSFHEEFVMGTVALGQVFLPDLRFSPVIIIPSLLHIHPIAYAKWENGLSEAQFHTHSLNPISTIKDTILLFSTNGKTSSFGSQLFHILKFRIVFWDVLPCKIIVDRRFRGTCCLHHQGSNLMMETIILQGSTSQNTILNFILAAVRT